MRNQLLYPALAVSLLLIGSSAQAQNLNPFVGNWRLDIQASTFEISAPPQRQTRAYQPRGGDTFVSLVDGLDADGNRIHVSATYKYDGLRYPLASLNQTEPLTIAYTRIDNFNVEYTIRSGDQVVQTGRKVLSRDRMTMTITVDQTNAQGRASTDRLVFRKN